MKVLGVDIGGTKIRFGIIDEHGKVYVDERIETGFPLYELLEEHVVRLVKEYPEIEAVGVGTAGFVDAKSGRIVYMSETLPGWTGTEVKKQLEAATGLRVEVENDANCAALAEAKFGSGREYERSVLLTLGTGLGGGIIVDRQILSAGPNGGAGEIGHMILYPGGEMCSCGRRGCFEQYVSGTALKRRIAEAELDMTPMELFPAAKVNEQAEKVVRDFTFDLACVISSLQAALDMEAVIIGGGVSESASYWMSYLEEQLDGVMLNKLDVKLASFENEAGILGAALLVLSE
ncbi:ROK family protein [Halalkalibacillus halophilus]|uniref:ROK family protein n=1 Tax=Halalkalibacillus halophilus TaxID=392827 RepID=UPI0004068F80|nr:ROK family protein [Halalkalibacillus halophilus]